jgi:TatD DNase family protein
MPRPYLVDAHCHLGDRAFETDREAVLDRARAAGVAHVVVIGESLAGSQRAAALARAASGGGLSATAGVHPHDASSWSAEVEARLRELLAAPEVVAVGETGLDYHYEHSPRDAQRRAFEAQLGLAAELGKSVVVHARAADADMAAMLRAWDGGGGDGAAVLHSFSSGAEVWEAGMAIGAYFSFSGMITFKNWTAVVPLTDYPPNRLLVETDAPFLAPIPYRGKRNEPAYVREVAARAAALRGEPLDGLAQRTTENARRCFGARLETAL